jgi:hypothetical protein
MVIDYRENQPRWKLRQRGTKRRLILRAETEAAALAVAEAHYGGKWRVKKQLPG